MPMRTVKPRPPAPIAAQILAALGGPATPAGAAFAAALVKPARHPRRGMLLAACPRGGTPAAAAWQAVMLRANPHKAGIGALIFMRDDQRAIYREVEAVIASFPRAQVLQLDHSARQLAAWGVL